MKTRTALVLSMAIIAMTHVFGNAPINYDFLKNDSIVDVGEKAEFLINTSKKLEQLDLSLSLDAITQAHDLSIKSKNDGLIARCNLQKGIVLAKNNNTEEALIALKKALAHYERSGDKASTASTLVDIGNAYSGNNQFKKSLIYYNSALAGFAGINDSLGIVTCFTHIGQSNSALGNNDKAIKYFTDAIDIAMEKEYNYHATFNYLNLSKIQLELDLTDDVQSQINLAMEIAKRGRFMEILSDAYLLSGRYHSAVGNKAEAANQFSNFIQQSDSLNNITSTELEDFLVELSNENARPKKIFETGFIFYLITAVMLIIALLLLFKIKKQRAIHKQHIEKCTSELEAFKANTVDLDETSNQKTKDRISEIERETSNNDKTKIALDTSLKNLDNINYLKDMFLSKISREIRTPLNGILGFSELLETKLVLLEDPKLFEYANNITQSGLSLVSLLNNILDISRLDSNNMLLDIKKQNTNELIQGVVDTYFPQASLKGIKLIYASQHIPHIRTDSQLFSKILSLILDNSIKFTEKGFIKISHDYDDEKNMINIFIKDTGIGIDKVYIGKVFEPFRQESLGYSKSYQGAGLGLPLAKKMSMKLEGGISIESEKGSGTTLTLNFPAYKTEEETTVTAKPKKTHEEPRTDTMPWETLSVLVVEDDNMNQILFRKMLKKAHHLEIAKDGKAAFASVEKQQKHNNFQLVLMDINLPDPWDGIKLMKEIRNKWPVYNNIPFIAQTAYAISGNREAMMDEGFDEYITKPIIKSNLVESVNRALTNKHLT